MDGDHPLRDSSTCLVVMYHYVHEAETPRREPLPGPTAAEFRGQIEQLCREMEPVSWPIFYSWLEGRAAVPRRSFLLTFDDGLADHARTVQPILDDMGLKGTFLVPALPLVEGRMLSAHAIHLLLSTLGDATLSRELGEVLQELGSGEDWLGRVDNAEATRIYHYETRERARLKHLLTMQLPVDLRDRAVEKLFERHIGSSRRWARRWYLSWDDIREMMLRGHTIGGHGYRHEPYVRLSPDDCRRDIYRTADILREALGPEPRPFSYPYGSVNEIAETACQAAGFVQAFTTIPQLARRGLSTASLPRVDTIAVDSFLKSHSCEVGLG